MIPRPRIMNDVFSKNMEVRPIIGSVVSFIKEFFGTQKGTKGIIVYVRNDNLYDVELSNGHLIPAVSMEYLHLITK